MLYILAVFKSRSETLYFANMLKNNGIAVSIINTPRAVSDACGISVKLSPKYLEQAKRYLSIRRFQSFVGFYSVALRNGFQDVRKLF